MITIKLDIQHWGLAPSFITSVVGHAAFLAAGLIGWRMHNAVFPVDAIEVASDVFIRTGMNSQARKASRSKSEASPVDLAVKKDQGKQEQAAAAQASVASSGQGGDAKTSQGQAASEWDQYRVRVRERIHEALLYPSVSKNLGEMGRVKVKFAVLRDGTIADVGIFEPSAFERLNTAAVATVKRVAHVDPLPAAFQEDRWETSIPIDFLLN